MKKPRFSDNQIIAALKRTEDGTSVPELRREHGVSSATFSSSAPNPAAWMPSLMGRMKELEEKYLHLKKMYAESQMSAEILREAMTKK